MGGGAFSAPIPAFMSGPYFPTAGAKAPTLPPPLPVRRAPRYELKIDSMKDEEFRFGTRAVSVLCHKKNHLPRPVNPQNLHAPYAYEQRSSSILHPGANQRLDRHSHRIRGSLHPPRLSLVLLQSTTWITEMFLPLRHDKRMNVVPPACVGR